MKNEIFDRVKALHKSLNDVNEAWVKSKNYAFSTNWLNSARVAEWKTALGGIAHQDGLKYLEIGVWEGRSLFWMLEHILTAPTSKATVIDPFLIKENWDTFRDNLRRSGQEARVNVLREFSGQALSKLERESFDVIYIDGAHDMRSVLVDGLYSWALLKPGGVIIFDDYLWNQSIYPLRLRPQRAIDDLLLIFKNQLKVLCKQYQVIVRKEIVSKQRQVGMSYFKHFSFEWNSQTLRHRDSVVALSPKQQVTLKMAILRFEDTLDVSEAEDFESKAAALAETFMTS